MSIGALIGGGIFAVLGVAAGIAGQKVIFSYILSGVIALCTGYSYSRYTRYLNADGGSYLFLRHYKPGGNTAGYVSWFLVIGYIGSMAMYAYAFSAFALFLLQHTVIANVPFIRPMISGLLVIFFAVINVKGVHATGQSENFMVGLKVLILLIFGIVGSIAIFMNGSETSVQTLSTPVSDFSFIFAISVIFVSFQGFQLLTYEYTVIRGGGRDLEWGIYTSIIISTLLYIMIAFVTTSILSPSEIIANEEIVLAVVASRIFDNVLIKSIASALIGIAALFSTASALNATIFGTSRLVKTIAESGEFPPFLVKSNKHGIAKNALLTITVITCLLSGLGSLETITGYASLSFLFIFAIVNYVSIKDKGFKSSSIISGIGLIGSVSALILFVVYVVQFELIMLYYILAITVAILILATIYFKFFKITKPNMMRTHVGIRTDPFINLKK